jgi:hypothetical protein
MMCFLRDFQVNNVRREGVTYEEGVSWKVQQSRDMEEVTSFEPEMSTEYLYNHAEIQTANI